MNFKNKQIDKITIIDSDTYQFDYANELVVKLIRRTYEWNVSLDIEINGRAFQYNRNTSDEDRVLFAMVSRLHHSDEINEQEQQYSNTRSALKKLGII